MRGWMSRWRSLVEPALVVLTFGALASGAIAWLACWQEKCASHCTRRSTTRCGSPEKPSPSMASAC
jgi:hypothetical protein